MDNPQPSLSEKMNLNNGIGLDISMPCIYLLTSPSEKQYVGQTKHTAEKRFKGHVHASKRLLDEGCTRLNRALRKYGPENFTIETIIECDEIDLNEWEQTYIEYYDTLSPNGYNLTTGGDHFILSEEARLHIKEGLARVKDIRSRNKRIYYKDQDLPTYVQRLKTEYGEGYIVEKPDCPNGQFCSDRWTMEQKKKMALEYLARLDSGDIPVKGNRNGLPTYVYKFTCPDKQGYHIKKPGFEEVWIRNSRLTMEEKREKILEVLESMDNGTFVPGVNRHRKHDKGVQMESGVSYNPKRGGYMYRRKGKKTCSFCDKDLPRETLRDMANEHAKRENSK